MEFMDVVEERRSIRRFYPKPIPMELIGELIHIGCSAPSIGDLQPWKYIVVTKPQTLQEVADSCPYERWLYQAPLMIVICAQSEKAETYYPGKGKLWASHSIAAAAQNMSLGAVDLGLGSCWVSAFETYRIKEALHIPEGIEPEIVLAVGYPDEEPQAKRKVPFHTNTFFNDFGRASTDISLHKRDYGEFVRDKIENVKTRAAYETAPRGGVRTAVDKARGAIKGMFARSPKKDTTTADDPKSEGEHKR